MSKYQVVKLNTIKQFSKFSDKIIVPLWPKNSYSDNVIEKYKHRQDVVENIAYYLQERLSGITTDGIILEGPSGSGKSSSLRQFLAILNYPIHSEVGVANSEREVLLGRLDPINGSLVFKDGPLTTAARHGHAFLFEERDCAPADVNKGLNNVLDGYDIHLPESGNGERVPLSKGFFFAATQNTTGGNDFSGESPAAQLQDSSSEDRFYRVYVPYMDQDDEVEVCNMKYPNLPLEIIKLTVTAANMVRSVYIGNRQGKPHASLEKDQITQQCSIAITTRGVERFLRKMIQHSSISDIEKKILTCVDEAFPLDKGNAEDRSFIEEVFKSQIIS